MVGHHLPQFFWDLDCCFGINAAELYALGGLQADAGVGSD